MPIVASFCRKIGLVKIVNQIVDSPDNIESGDVVLAMILDTLNGRTPLYKLIHSFERQDVPVIFGKDIDLKNFNDHNVETERPTTLMVFFHFEYISIFRWDKRTKRKITRPLTDYQQEYLQALKLPEDIFINPYAIKN